MKTMKITGGAIAVSATFTAMAQFSATQEGIRAKPATVLVDFAAEVGKVKPMNAVNNGPTGRPGPRYHDNFDSFKAARIPYGRTHDASEYIVYGGDHCVDISAVFPNFDADEDDPASYDFPVTDKYLDDMAAAGVEPFFRLGQRIEHAVRKYNIFAPRDFAKWARIAEHVILHCNEGWANGHKRGIKYWEIWNEADGDAGREDNPHTWGGTPQQFYAFYETVAKHLKPRFPHLKIGGPAATGSRPKWCDEFLKYQHERGTPIDFFSWHCYAVDPAMFVKRARDYRAMMEKYGYGNAESILNEWNYAHGQAYHYSIMSLASQKGAAFLAAVMIACQAEPVDMLMYYDAKPDAHFNGVFDKVSLMPAKPYYALYAWGKLASACDIVVKASADIPDLYVTAAKGKADRHAIFVARYSNDNNFVTPRPITLRIAGAEFPHAVTAHVLDDVRMYTETTLWPSAPDTLAFTLAPQSFVMIEFSRDAGMQD